MKSLIIAAIGTSLAISTGNLAWLWLILIALIF